MDMFFSIDKKRRFLLQKLSSQLPEPHLWYSTKDLIEVLRLFLDAGNDISESPTYRYDLVDLTRQVLSKLANQVYVDAVTAFQKKDVKVYEANSNKFVQLIKDIDTLSETYEWNARTQVTMWYDTTKTNQSKLHDYGNKFWSGLLEMYYLPRASSYFHYLSKSLRENKDFEVENSNNWQAGTEPYPVKAKGDALSISRALYNKYLL